MRLFGDLPYGAAEIDIHHAHAKLMRQPSSHRGQVVGVVVPDLYRQGAGLVGHPPEAVRKTVVMPADVQKAAGVHHFGRLQAGPPVLADDLAEGVVGKPRHGRLQHRRIDNHRPDPQRCGARGGQPRHILPGRDRAILGGRDRRAVHNLVTPERIAAPGRVIKNFSTKQKGTEKTNLGNTNHQEPFF